MSLTSGFYNSIGGDRRYNASQMSALFDGIIMDGVFASIGDALIVSAATGMNINIGTGRAWFNHTWINNDADILLTIDQSEVVLHRVDMVVLEVDSSDSVRASTIKIIKGIPGSSPVATALVSTEFVHQYPLCHIYVGAGVSSILQSNITNKIGTVACPFIAGVLETVNIEDLLAQWAGEFNDWFTTIQAILDENTAGNLLNLITENTSRIEDVEASLEDLANDVITNTYIELDASNTDVAGTKKADALCWDGQCVYANTSTTLTGALVNTIIDSLRFGGYSLSVRLRSANKTIVTGSIVIKIQKNISGVFTDIATRTILPTEFTDITNYQNFYLEFDYGGAKATDNQIKILINLNTQSSVYEIALDSIYIYPKVVGIFRMT